MGNVLLASSPGDRNFSHLETGMPAGDRADWEAWQNLRDVGGNSFFSSAGFVLIMALAPMVY